MQTFADFDTAYRQSLRDLVEHGSFVNGIQDASSIGSSFGTSVRPTKELIAYGFRLSNPNNSYLWSTERKIDYGYACANLIWFLSGSCRVDDITFYNSRGAQFSDDGKHFSGALGHRATQTGVGNQIEAVIRILRDDPTSRRAFVLIYREHDSILRPRDTPCSIGLHFLVRNGCLCCVCNMRSQSAAMVMPYDVHLFTSIQILISHSLKLQAGPYVHIANSMHYYIEEEPIVRRIIDETVSVSMNHLPPITPSDVLLVDEAILEENRMRAHLQTKDLDSFVIDPKLRGYWTNGLLLAQQSWMVHRSLVNH